MGADKVPENLRSAIPSILPGDSPGSEEYELQHDGRGQLDWRQLLRRYVGQVVEVRPTYSRPSRRFPDWVGVIPGRRRQSDRPKIMAVIDTSGSITPKLLELIDGELARLGRDYVVTVVECDTQIHTVYEYKPLTSVTGRGGTDLRPPFAKDFLRKHHPDIVVYFTDGYGPAPERSPAVPVVWCLVPDGDAPSYVGAGCADTGAGNAHEVTKKGPGRTKNTGLVPKTGLPGRKNGPLGRNNGGQIRPRRPVFCTERPLFGMGTGRFWDTPRQTGPLLGLPHPRSHRVQRRLQAVHRQREPATELPPARRSERVPFRLAHLHSVDFIEARGHDAHQDVAYQTC